MELNGRRVAGGGSAPAGRAGLEYVTLVDSDDRPIGHAEKMQAHREGLLHRACSVVLFDGDGRMLLQQRSLAKYHSAGLWSNTCCTHPWPNEPVRDAAVRRVREEMGIDVELEPLFEFVYRAEVENGLVEHEYDHVFGGIAESAPVPNAVEVADWRWASFDEIARDLRVNRASYSTWFPLIFERLAGRS